MTEPRDLFDLRGGTVADRYAIEEVVGENAYSVVYRGRDLTSEALVAVKIFKVLGEFSDEERASLLRKLEAASADITRVAPRAPVITAPLEIGKLTRRDGNWVPYMAVEWMDGASLRAIRKEEQYYALPPRTLAQVMALLEPAAQALALAHQNGLVHAGLTASSIFVIGDPRAIPVDVRLIDFGVARALTQASRGDEPSSSRAGGFTMTPTYYNSRFAAPEQVEFTGEAIGTATDVYSFALVIAHMLAYPPADPTAARDPATYRGTPAARGVSVPQAVEEVFARALSRNPAQRQPGVGELWNELRMALGNASIEDMPGAAASAPGAAELPDADATVRMSDPEIVDAFVKLDAGPVGEADATRERAALKLSLPPEKRRRPVLVATLVALFVIAGGVVLVLHQRGQLAGLLQRAGVTPAAPTTTAVAPTAAPSASASATASASAAPSAIVVSGSCPDEMALIPGGHFSMGSNDKEAPPYEKPARGVTLAPYCLDIHEVTVSEYQACTQRKQCVGAGRANDWEGIDRALHRNLDIECNIRRPGQRAKHPINCVSWEMADHYCRAHHKQLPTEAQWEFAASGGGTRKYPWGDEAPDAKRLNACGSECVAWVEKHRMADVLSDGKGLHAEDDGFPTTAPVGSYPDGASKFGNLDLAGNVWEWVGDWYAFYGRVEETDPAGAASGEQRVVRGGDWTTSSAATLRPSFRSPRAPNTRSYAIGFRCAKPITPDGG